MAASNTIAHEKKTRLFVILAAIFLVNALLAELIGVKIFSLEQTFGFSSAQIPLFGTFVLDFNLTAGAIIWPAVFITTDIINEYFGREGVRRITYLTVAMIGFAFLVIWIVTKLPAAPFWLDINSKDPNGNSFDPYYAFNFVFWQWLD